MEEVSKRAHTHVYRDHTGNHKPLATLKHSIEGVWEIDILEPGGRLVYRTGQVFTNDSLMQILSGLLERIDAMERQNKERDQASVKDNKNQ